MDKAVRYLRCREKGMPTRSVRHCHSSKDTSPLSTTKCAGASPRPRWRRRSSGGRLPQLKRCHLMQHRLRRYEFFKYPHSFLLSSQSFAVRRMREGGVLALERLGSAVVPIKKSEDIVNRRNRYRLIHEVDLLKFDKDGIYLLLK